MSAPSSVLAAGLVGPRRVPLLGLAEQAEAAAVEEVVVSGVAAARVVVVPRDAQQTAVEAEPLRAFGLVLRVGDVHVLDRREVDAAGRGVHHAHLRAARAAAPNDDRVAAGEVRPPLRALAQTR